MLRHPYGSLSPRGGTRQTPERRVRRPTGGDRSRATGGKSPFTLADLSWQERDMDIGRWNTAAHATKVSGLAKFRKFNADARASS
jgi:hypothetical protein